MAWDSLGVLDGLVSSPAPDLLDRRRRLGGPASRPMGAVIWSAPTGKTYKTLAEQAHELVREG